MSDKLAFYDVNPNYADYLKQFDNRIPNFNYSQNNKFVCGIVLSINGFDYYAPISSNKQIFKTSFPIYDGNNIISTIRFSFMFPIPDGCCTQKDFRKIEDYRYRRLLNKEVLYCNQHLNQILKKAAFIYDRTVNKKDPVLTNNCCDFKLLEQKSQCYIQQMQTYQLQPNSQTAEPILPNEIPDIGTQGFGGQGFGGIS